MPRQSEDLQAAHRIRDAGIAQRAENGETYADIARTLDMEVGAVGMALTRHRRRGGEVTPAETVKDRTGRTKRKRALDNDGTTYHARGQILVEDEPQFNAMVDRAKPAVEKALKGESDERDGDER